MKNETYSLHDINEEIIKSADLYLRTTIINKSRRYKRKLTKLLRHGISMLELEKYESNLICNDKYFNNHNITYFCIKGNNIPIAIPELAVALKELTEVHFQVIMQTAVLQLPIEEVAKGLGVSKRTINTYKRDAIEELRKRMKNYEE